MCGLSPVGFYSFIWTHILQMIILLNLKYTLGLMLIIYLLFLLFHPMSSTKLYLGPFFKIFCFNLAKFEKIGEFFFIFLENLKSTFSDVIWPPEQFWIHEHALKNPSIGLKIAFEKSHFLQVFGFIKIFIHLLNKLFHHWSNWGGSY